MSAHDPPLRHLGTGPPRGWWRRERGAWSTSPAPTAACAITWPCCPRRLASPALTAFLKSRPEAEEQAVVLALADIDPLGPPPTRPIQAPDRSSRGPGCLSERRSVSSG